jgi:hypothetical protein
MTEFVRVRHPDIDGESDVPAGALEAYKARGWEPISEPRSWSRAQDEVTIAAQQETAEVADARAEAEEHAGDRVDQIIDRVGDDPVLAAEALRVENEKTQPRVTLVAELERIAGSDPRTDAAPDQGSD